MKCKICKTKFEPTYSWQALNGVCSGGCAYKLTEIKKENAVKEKVKGFKEKLKTKSDYIRDLQKLVNIFIRKRDLGNRCISCETILTEKTKYDAGHFYPTTYQVLRFNEDNIHGQCVRCNRDLHGNISEYRPRIEEKIGVDRVQWLHAHRHDRMDLSIEDLKNLITEYKLKIKQ